MEKMVGERFHPTDEELMSYYLSNKILGKDWLVQNAINEISICKFDPWQLPQQSKIQSSDQVWYFFCPRDNKYSNSKRTNRKTSCGFWKATGVDRKIRAKRGNRGIIGSKKTLVFYKGRVPKGERTDWVMHEYHLTLIPDDQRTYVLCKIKDKSGEYTGIPSCNGNEPSHSLASDSINLAAINPEFEQPTNRLTISDQEFLNESENAGRFVEDILVDPHEFVAGRLIQETPESFYGLSDYDLAVQLNEQEGIFLSELQFTNEFTNNPNPNVQQPINRSTIGDQGFLLESEDVDPRFVEDFLLDPDEVSYEKSLHGHCNDYRPPKSLTGVYLNYSSDSDTETICAVSHQEISSPVDSVGSSNQSNPKKPNNVAQEHPTRFQLQGRVTRVAAAKDKGNETSEADSAVQAYKNKKSSIQRSEKERKTAQENNKRTFATNSKEKGCISFLKTIEISPEPNPPSVYLMNAAVGLILFVVVLGGIMFVH